MNRERPEKYSKIARIFNEWDYSEMTVYLEEGVILYGRSDGWVESYYDIDTSIMDDFKEGYLGKIKIIKLPDNPEWEEYKDGRKFLIVGEHRIMEGGGTGFNNLDEPEKIVLEDGRVIWDKEKNFCLRYDFDTKETYEDKIR